MHQYVKGVLTAYAKEGAERSRDHLALVIPFDQGSWKDDYLAHKRY